MVARASPSVQATGGAMRRRRAPTEAKAHEGGKGAILVVVVISTA
jgi:hypothetical protein